MSPREASPLVKGAAYRNPDEAAFFRDTAALLSLKTLMRRRLDASEAPERPVRVWVPRCSNGPDAYSIAITLLEAMGSRWREVPLCVFATDHDADELARGRAGRYSRLAVQKVAPARLARFFTEEGSFFRPKAFVRQTCRFVRHDDAENPPFTRLDLIACRGLLGEGTADARRAALGAMHAVLAPGGLLLDSSGAAALAPDLFAPAGRGGAYVALPLGGQPLGGRPRESEKHLRILMSRTDEAVFVRDAATGRILLANEAASHLYGWSVKELLGMRGDELISPPPLIGRTGPERRSANRQSLPQHRRKDGTSFPVDIRSNFLMSQGRPCHLDMVRNAAPRLRLAAGRRREAERDTFLGEVVHELRNPLAVIRGSAESLRRGGNAPKDRKAYLGFIEDSSARMARLVDRLLDLSSAEAAKRGAAPARLSLSAAVWEIAETFRPIAARRAVKIKVDIPGDLSVNADPADLPHIFGNLLDNAIKFSPRGGRVSVSASAYGGEARVSVCDSGPGIAAADLERVFERFFRAESAKRVKGTGLGLAIVRAMVAANQGAVVAENGASRGTVFKVTLPLAQENA